MCSVLVMWNITDILYHDTKFCTVIATYVMHALVLTQVRVHCLICLHNTQGHGQVQTYQTMQKYVPVLQLIHM